MTEAFVREKDGQIRIHEFEKHYLTLCLKKEIEKVEGEVTKLKEYSGPGITTSNIADAIECSYLRDLQVVLERVEAHPSGRW